MATINKFNKFLLTQMNGGTDTTGGSTSSSARVVDFDTDTIKVMLVSSAFTPSATGHSTKTSVTSEVSGTNYTAGGATLGSVTVADSSGVITFAAADTVWTSSGSGFSTARYAIIYKDTGTAGTSTLIGWVDFGINCNNTSANFTIQWSTSGIATWA